MPVYLNGEEFETLKEYELRITEDISNWDWSDDDGFPCEDEEGKPIYSVYLGSCFDLNYSGKYYMPYACSNVNHCEYCNGSGVLGWYAGYNIAALPQYRHTYIRTHDCIVCGGVGSEEAAKDAVFYEVLEQIASEHNMWVVYDGTDVFLQWERECNEEEEED